MERVLYYLENLNFEPIERPEIKPRPILKKSDQYDYSLGKRLIS